MFEIRQTQLTETMQPTTLSKRGINKAVQEAEFLNHICTLTKDLGVLLHLDA